MKRRAFQILVLLIMGAIVNVAVAWGLVFMAKDAVPRIMIHNDIFPEPYRHNYGLKGRGPIATYNTSVTDRVVGLAKLVQMFQRCSDLQVDGANVRSACQCKIVAGWPLLSFGTGWRPYSEFSGIHRRPRTWLVQEVHQPHWPGFAINTIFYAAILWMVFALPFVLRLHVRRRRGLCPACAYPIGTNSVCTECGAAVTAKERAH